jgi:FtsH-binding integral membrane protein
MADPATSVAAAVAAGAGAAVLSSLGLEAPPLFWALVGATLGMSFAAASSKPRAAIVFSCVVLVCSLFGAWLSVKFTSGEQISRNAFACVLAIVFHPLLNALITKLPEVIDDLRRKFFGGSNA